MMQLCIKMQFLSVFPIYVSDIKKLLISGEEMLISAEVKCYVIHKFFESSLGKV